MIKTIIYSKDRAAQLDALLRSIATYYPGCSMCVIYKATDEDYQKGYDRLFSLHDVPHIKESDFQEDTVREINNKYIMFLMDDMQFIDYFTPDAVFDAFADSNDTACLSLRLYPGIVYSYTRDLLIVPPDENKWAWKGRQSYWGYPMSLDGHIFRSDDLLNRMSVLSYDNPNELESLLAVYYIDKPFMMCYDRAKVVNYPFNVVQHICNNRSMGLSTRYLNEQYLSGLRLKLMQPVNHIGCHVEQYPEWE